MKNKFKTKLFCMLFAACLIVTFTSCKKYKDGSVISFKSRTERVSNTWIVDNYTVDGKDFTSFYIGYEEIFSKDGRYSYNSKEFKSSGKWCFENNDTEIHLDGDDGEFTRRLIVSKLKENELWFNYVENDEKHEFHLKSK